MRVGVSSYWFNRGQGVVGRQLRSALETLGHETFVLARPTRETNIKPSFVDRPGSGTRAGVTVASTTRSPRRSYSAWARTTRSTLRLFDQNYQFDEIAALREAGVGPYGRFVWEHFSRRARRAGARAFDRRLLGDRAASSERYAELGHRDARAFRGESTPS